MSYQNRQSEGVITMSCVEGTVKFAHPEKGYGFMVVPEMSDVFFHFSDFDGPERRDHFSKLKAGSVCKFDIEEASDKTVKNKYRARNLKIVSL